MKPFSLVLLLALFSLGVQAAPGGHGFGLYTVAEQSSGITLDQAVEQVREQTGGRILSAETVRRDGQRIHRIKVLTRNNKVRIIRIPANGH